MLHHRIAKCLRSQCAVFKIQIEYLSTACSHAEPWQFCDHGGELLLGAKHWFLPAVKKAGVTDFTWHDLRHTVTSRLVMADVDIRTVANLLGSPHTHNDDAIHASRPGT